MSYLDELADSLVKKTEDFSKKAVNIYEGQKIKGKILSEEHMVKKLKGDIGNLIYEKYREGVEVDESLKGFCEEIDQHMQIIAGYRANAAALRDEKICPGCGRSVDISVCFCPHCGTPCPTPEPEPVKEEAEETEAEAEKTEGEEMVPEAEGKDAPAEAENEPANAEAAMEAEEESAAPEASEETVPVEEEAAFEAQQEAEEEKETAEDADAPEIVEEEVLEAETPVTEWNAQMEPAEEGKQE